MFCERLTRIVCKSIQGTNETLQWQAVENVKACLFKEKVMACLFKEKVMACLFKEKVMACLFKEAAYVLQRFHAISEVTYNIFVYLFCQLCNRVYTEVGSA